MELITSKEVNFLLNAIEDLIDIKILIRSIVPKYNLDDFNHKRLITLLSSLNEKLNPLFVRFLDLDRSSVPPESKTSLVTELKQVIDQNMFVLVSSSSAKKKLKHFGIDARNILVSGGPIFFDNYKKINKDIPEKAIPGLEKECARLVEELKDAANNLDVIIFIYEMDNITDKVILEEIEDLAQLLKKPIQKYELQSWQNLDT